MRWASVCLLGVLLCWFLTSRKQGQKRGISHSSLTNQVHYHSLGTLNSETIYNLCVCMPVSVVGQNVVHNLSKHCMWFYCTNNTKMLKPVSALINFKFYSSTKQCYYCEGL